MEPFVGVWIQGWSLDLYLVPLEQLARDDETLDLVGALADNHQRGVSVVARG